MCYSFGVAQNTDFIFEFRSNNRFPPNALQVAQSYIAVYTYAHSWLRRSLCSLFASTTKLRVVWAVVGMKASQRITVRSVGICVDKTYVYRLTFVQIHNLRIFAFSNYHYTLTCAVVAASESVFCCSVYRMSQLNVYKTLLSLVTRL